MTTVFEGNNDQSDERLPFPTDDVEWDEVEYVLKTLREKILSMRRGHVSYILSAQRKYKNSLQWEYSARLSTYIVRRKWATKQAKLHMMTVILKRIAAENPATNAEVYVSKIIEAIDFAIASVLLLSLAQQESFEEANPVRGTKRRKRTKRIRTLWETDNGSNSVASKGLIPSFTQPSFESASPGPSTSDLPFSPMTTASPDASYRCGIAVASIPTPETSVLEPNATLLEAGYRCGIAATSSIPTPDVRPSIQWVPPLCDGPPLPLARPKPRPNILRTKRAGRRRLPKVMQKLPAIETLFNLPPRVQHVEIEPEYWEPILPTVRNRISIPPPAISQPPVGREIKTECITPPMTPMKELPSADKTGLNKRRGVNLKRKVNLARRADPELDRILDAVIDFILEKECRDRMEKLKIHDDWISKQPRLDCITPPCTPQNRSADQETHRIIDVIDLTHDEMQAAPTPTTDSTIPGTSQQPFDNNPWVTMVQNTKWTDIQRFIRFTRTSIFGKQQKPLDSIVATRERLRKHQAKHNTINMSPPEYVAWSTMEAKIAILSALVHRFNLATRKHDENADFISNNLPMEAREVVEEIFTEALDRITSCIKREQGYARCMADYITSAWKTSIPSDSITSTPGLSELLLSSSLPPLPSLHLLKVPYFFNQPVATTASRSFFNGTSVNLEIPQDLPFLVELASLLSLSSNAWLPSPLSMPPVRPTNAASQNSANIGSSSMTPASSMVSASTPSTANQNVATERLEQGPLTPQDGTQETGAKDAAPTPTAEVQKADTELPEDVKKTPRPPTPEEVSQKVETSVTEQESESSSSEGSPAKKSRTSDESGGELSDVTPCSTSRHSLEHTDTAPREKSVRVQSVQTESPDTEPSGVSDNQPTLDTPSSPVRIKIEKEEDEEVEVLYQTNTLFKFLGSRP